MPSSVPVGGIRMSVTTTSGACSATSASSCGRSEATPTSSKSLLADTRRDMPSRRRTLSSASATLTVFILNTVVVGTPESARKHPPWWSGWGLTSRYAIRKQCYLALLDPLGGGYRLDEGRF